MKDQYVGDAKDFFTYGLLRALAGPELPLVVCWMLTPPDQSGDGRRTGYLASGRFRRLDPELHDALRGLVERDARSVGEVERLALVDAAYVRTLEHVPPAPPALVFLDPDLGFEAASVPPRSRRAGRYVSWAQVRELHERGHSLLVFQHALRVSWSELLPRLALRAREALGPVDVRACVTRRGVAFVLLAQTAHGFLSRRLEDFASRWTPEVETWTAS